MRTHSLCKYLTFRWACLRAGAPPPGRIPSYTSIFELQALYRIVCALPVEPVCVEIGSHLGASTCAIAAGLKRKKGSLLCIDAWDNTAMTETEVDTFSAFSENVARLNVRPKTLRIRYEDLRPADLPLQIDFVFLDGDHHYLATLREFRLVADRMKSSGIVAFHDCTSYVGVSRAIGQILSSGLWQLAGCLDNLCWLSPFQYVQRPFQDPPQERTFLSYGRIPLSDTNETNFTGSRAVF
jgi:hypothetical protein